MQFVTKGEVPKTFLDLFAEHPELVAGQVGLTTLDMNLNAAIEPKAATAVQRLNSLGKLIDVGVTASLRADPLIYGVTGHDKQLENLFASVSECGVKDVSVSYLFLRPAIIGSLRRNIDDQELLDRIMKPFEKGSYSKLRSGGSQSGDKTLSQDMRQKEFDRIRCIASQYGLSVQVCGCKNSDITNGKCHLTNLTVTARARKLREDQANLW
ncbi:hypothetical protein JD969_08475 [Planctomycetota bacterium]|nr:hypothetical protein JD969_08475 [Planctomycetota bacterium]